MPLFFEIVLCNLYGKTTIARVILPGLRVMLFTMDDGYADEVGRVVVIEAGATFMGKPMRSLHSLETFT